MTPALDFSQVKAGASFEQILDYYNMAMRGSGKQRITLCPFHADSRPSCSINLERKVFNCFGCGVHGSVLDFVANLDRISIQEASIRVAEICGLIHQGRKLDPQKIRRNQDNHYREKRQLSNLVAELQKLDPSHPYLVERGISPEVAAEFGLLYCERGMMRHRICIPIHDEKGGLVSYAGRFASNVIPKGVMKYYLPSGFEKRWFLFGFHRVTGTEHLILVEGYWSVMRLQKLDIPAVGLMGRTMSAEQEELLVRSGIRKLTLLLDGDKPGREATEQLVPRLAEQFFVHAGRLPNWGEPDTVPEETLRDVLS